jgi:antitoxin (DNA-binding transcriptional repressor) of toxin-antitoxin stability system
MLGIEIVGIKLAHPMMKAQPFAQPTRGSGVDQRRVMARGAPGSLQRSGEPIVLTRHGRPVAVVLEHAAFERLVAAAEDASDRVALAFARDDDDSVPWEQVKVDLGLV